MTTLDYSVVVLPVVACFKAEENVANRWSSGPGAGVSNAKKMQLN
jgi:hypothetical protein